MSLRDFLFGRPISDREQEHEKIGWLPGVAALGLDAVASSAYGPEALLTVLIPLGVPGVHYTWTLSLVIVALLGLLTFSYRQTIDAYPGGGGAYTVAKENLGTSPSLFAAAALSVDYILNVAVAISAGIGALVSVSPRLLPHTIELCLAVLLLLTLLNLRGIRATGLAFSAPAYLFVFSWFVVIAVGLGKTFLEGGRPQPVVAPPAPLSPTVSSASEWLLLRAFANGCTAMTGVEAVSNGVPIFRRPSIANAQRTLTTIAIILACLLIGEAFLCRAYGITARPPGQPGYESVLSQIAGVTIGRGWFYYLAMGSVITVLVLSANTSFADFPRVCRLLAVDKYLPEPFALRGRRLTFSFGILLLCTLAGGLLVIFRGITDRLIPLFAVGALCAFSISQSGMVAHWRKHKGGQAKRSLILNLLGAVGTAATLVAVLVSKLSEGAWISLVLAAGMILLYRGVRRHYRFVERATATTASLAVGPYRPPIAVVPLRRWDAVALKALRFALGITSEIVVVQILTGDREVDDLSSRWSKLVDAPSRAMGIEPPGLVVVRSEYRRLFEPLLEVVKELGQVHPDRQIAVIVPELVETRWFYSLLHKHTASVLKTLLLVRGGPQIVIIDTPWHLREWLPERKRLLSMPRTRRWLPARRRG